MIKEEMIERGEELADEHWTWVNGLLVHIYGGDINLDSKGAGYLYLTAFEHGFKHGIKEAQHDPS